MNSQEMIDRLVNPEQETTDLILKAMPIAVKQAAVKIISDGLLHCNFANLSHEETLHYIFLAGYTTARQEDRIILEDTFINKE